MPNAERYFQRFATAGMGGTGVPVSGTAEVTLAVGSARKTVIAQAVAVFRATGAGGNIQPRLYNISGGAAGSVGERWRASAATAGGTLVNTTGINRPLVTDASGNLYFSVSGDAGDTFDYEVILEQAWP